MKVMAKNILKISWNILNEVSEASIKDSFDTSDELGGVGFQKSVTIFVVV